MLDVTSVDLHDWRDAITELREEEKLVTDMLDALAAKRRRLPGVEVTADHRFVGPDGEVGLEQLFEGRRQLIVYSFMLPPGSEHVCEGCSMFTDHLPHLAHLHARQTTLALVSRAPFEELERVRERMGWSVPWYSTVDGSFAREIGTWTDAGDSFALDVFVRDGDRIVRTYTTDGRGVENLGSTWALLDLTPLGRQETWEDSPAGRPQDPPYSWWRLHDDYDEARP